MQPRIVVLSGVRAGEVCPLTADAFSIGRDEEANFSIDDPWLSRRHCAVTFENGEYQVEDFGSDNGTSINGEAITGKRMLRDGDRIGVGDTELLFLTEADSEADPDGAEPPVYLDDTPVDDPETVAVEHSNLQLSALIDVANAFRNTRDVSSIREKLISLIFATIPADRVAILLKDSDGAEFESRAGRNRRDPTRSIQASRSIANRVYKRTLRFCRTIFSPLNSNRLKV